MTITIDRAAGLARMSTGAWSQVVPGDELIRQLRFYRRLWSRKPKGKEGVQSDDKTPGPWAEHYEDIVRALECAVREWMA